MITTNNTNYSDKEQKLIFMIENEMKENKNWAENIYEDDDDPHSEMLIKYMIQGVEESCSHYLNIVLTNAPEHKLKVLGGYLLSGVLIEYLTYDHESYADNLLKRFPNILENNSFLKGFVYKVNQCKNYKALYNMEQNYDTDLKKCKLYITDESKEMFEKYDLFKHLNGKLINKEIYIKKTKL